MKPIIAIIFFTFLSFSLQAETAKLSARGEARLSAPPDQMTITIGTVTENKVVQEALSQNSAAVNKIMDAVKSLNLKNVHIETSMFRIDPIWQTKPVNPTPDWKPMVISFRVTNLLDIRTSDLTAAGTVIDAAINAGANKVDALAFNLKDPEALRSKAIAMATAQAMEQAKVAANAANVTLGQVLNLTIDNAGIRPPLALRAMEASTPIEAGEIQVSATVNMDFEIRSH